MKFTPSTVSRNIASIKAFYHFLFKQRLIEEDISDMLRAPKIEKKIPTAAISIGKAIALKLPLNAATPRAAEERIEPT